MLFKKIQNNLKMLLILQKYDKIKTINFRRNNVQDVEIFM